MTKVPVSRIKFIQKIRLTYFQGGKQMPRKGLKQLISLKAIINYESIHVWLRWMFGNMYIENFSQHLT